MERENEELRRRLQQSVKVTSERLERLLLTGTGEMFPYEAIRAMVKVAFIKNTVNQEYLCLLAPKHNIEPFARGKRQGHSPFELLIGC